MKVLVIGAGTGGLCLAHALRRGGVEVAVFERDRTPTHQLQGYRVGISPDGSRALHACLPPEQYAEFARTAAKSIKRINFRTERLRTLLTAEVEGSADPVHSEKSISRITLRRVLLSGLEDVVAFDRTFTHYEQHPDGPVTAHFADGSTATGDVLVAADGSNSRVRGQYLPQARLVDTGLVGIAGKVPMTPETTALLPPNAREGITMVFAPKGSNLLIHVMEFTHDRQSVPKRDGLLWDNESDYIMWAYSTAQAKIGDLRGQDGEALKLTVLERTRRWHPNVRELVRRTDAGSVFPIGIRTSEPVEPWRSSTVTLLGDAIHTMTPGRGVGANTALRDAELLSRKLIAAHRGEADLVPAIGEYEAEMIRYGFEAVLESRQNFDGDGPMHKPVIGRVVLAVFRTVLRVVNLVPSLKKKFLDAQNRLRRIEEPVAQRS
jgi:2-polyprenyl-6-methoxyphenol hydroxylase-like FAD-dependent oxidoreductase